MYDDYMKKNTLAVLLGFLCFLPIVQTQGAGRDPASIPELAEESQLKETRASLKKIIEKQNRIIELQKRKIKELEEELERLRGK
jgi:hypothetical protein